MYRTPPLLSVLVLLAGCGLVDAPGEPLIEAHRGAAGYWPQNSRAAMLGAIARGYDALEFDLVLTADREPVLAHDPWVHQELCTTASGDPVEGEVLIMDLTLDELLEGYLCGGVPDPEFPDAEVVAEEPMTFEELLEALADAPDMLVHIDVKYEPDLTPPPDVFADEVLARWWDADLPNPWYVSANTAETTRAFEDRGDQEGEDVPTSLAWPRFPPGSSSVAIAMEAELMAALGARELVSIARDARADGLAIPWQVADRRRIEVARSSGVEVQLWTLNSASLLSRFHRWPVQSLITDFPEEAP